MAKAAGKKRKSIFDKIRESGWDRLYQVQAPPVRTPSLRPSPSEMNHRVMMIMLHELEGENRNLRRALTEATFKVDAMSEQVAVAKKLLGAKIQADMTRHGSEPLY